MKQLLLLPTLLLTINSFSQDVWQSEGLPEFADGFVYDMVFHGSNPAVFYKELATNKTSVKEFTGGTWSYVGISNFSNGNDIGDGAMAVSSNNELYCAYADNSYSDKLVVKKFNGTSWVSVGTNGFTPSSADWVDIQLNSADEPYVAYRDNSVSGKVSVMKFNGTSWVNVGTPGFSAGNAWYEDIEFDESDVPYVAYTDQSDNSKVYVKKFDGSSWIDLPAGASSGAAGYLNLQVVFSNSVYVSYIDGDLASSAASAKVYDGSSWTYLDAAGFTSATGSGVTDIVMAKDPNDEIFCSVIKAGSEKLYCTGFNGMSWYFLGSDGFSPEIIEGHDFVFSPTGVPYVAFQTSAAKISVMKYEACPDVVDVSVTSDLTSLACVQTGATYQWLDCDNGYAPISGATNQNYNPILNGNYSCEITLGCAKDTSNCFNISGLGVESQNQINITLYPNPTSGEIFIQTAEKINQIQITDMNGRLLLKSENADEIGLSTFENGIYLLQIETENGTFVEHVIKR